MMLFAVLLMSCDSRQDLMHGYQIYHADGSEMYLFKNGEGVTPYVSLVALGDDFFIVEEWSLHGKAFSYERISCEYFLIDSNGSRGAELSDLNGTVVEAKSNLSCLGRLGDVEVGNRIVDVDDYRK